MNQARRCLDVRNLQKNYHGRSVVNGLSFHVHQGEIVGLLGPNGAGKTTSFYMTIGLIAPDGGEVIFQGNNVTYLPIHKRAQMGMGYLAQEPSIFRQLSVEENILCILESLPLSPRERILRLENLLEELHLTPFRKKKALSLSGGERRRLEITRSLVTNPSFLLLDEPFANIDPLSIAEVKHMVQLLAKRGISVLITDHNAREIFSVVDRCYLIQQGRVVFVGSPEECAEDEEVRRTYLGMDFS